MEMKLKKWKINSSYLSEMSHRNIQFAFMHLLPTAFSITLSKHVCTDIFFFIYSSNNLQSYTDVCSMSFQT